MPTAPVASVAPGAPVAVPLPEYRDVPITYGLFIIQSIVLLFFILFFSVIKVRFHHMWKKLCFRPMQKSRT